MADAIDLLRVPEEQRVAYYGLLFALAAADGSFDVEEKRTIYALLDLEGMSPEARETVRAFGARPPVVRDCLEVLVGAPDELRFGVLASLVDVALSDMVLAAEEVKALEEARVALGATHEQLELLKAFIREVQTTLQVGEEVAGRIEALEAAARAMVQVGVPIAAAWFAAGVNALKSRGMESARAAIGLGLGMVPGLPISVLVGLTVQVSVGELLRGRPGYAATGNRAPRADLAVRHLQDAVDEVTRELEAARESGDETQRLALEERRDGLLRLVMTRRSALEDNR